MPRRRTRGALLAALALPAATALAPGPATAAEPACGSSPSLAVRAYYRRIDDGRFPAAWRCLGPRTQERLGGFARWRAGFARTLQMRLVYQHVEEGTPALATITFTLRTCTAAGEDRRVERFTGTWIARRTSGSWRLQSPSVARTARVSRPRC